MSVRIYLIPTYYYMMIIIECNAIKYVLLTN